MKEEIMNRIKQLHTEIERLDKEYKVYSEHDIEYSESIKYNIDKRKWEIEDLLKTFKEELKEKEDTKNSKIEEITKEAQDKIDELENTKIVEITKEAQVGLDRLEKEYKIYSEHDEEYSESIKYNMDKISWKLEEDIKLVRNDIDTIKLGLEENIKNLNEQYEIEKNSLLDEIQKTGINLEEYGLKEKEKDDTKTKKNTKKKSTTTKSKAKTTKTKTTEPKTTKTKTDKTEKSEIKTDEEEAKPKTAKAKTTKTKTDKTEKSEIKTDEEVAKPKTVKAKTTKTKTDKTEKSETKTDKTEKSETKTDEEVAKQKTVKAKTTKTKTSETKTDETEKSETTKDENTSGGEKDENTDEQTIDKKRVVKNPIFIKILYNAKQDSFIIKNKLFLKEEKILRSELKDYGIEELSKTELAEILGKSVENMQYVDIDMYRALLKYDPDRANAYVDALTTQGKTKEQIKQELEDNKMEIEYNLAGLYDKAKVFDPEENKNKKYNIYSKDRIEEILNCANYAKEMEIATVKKGFKVTILEMISNIAKKFNVNLGLQSGKIKQIPETTEQREELEETKFADRIKSDMSLEEQNEYAETVAEKIEEEKAQANSELEIEEK